MSNTLRGRDYANITATDAAALTLKGDPLYHLEIAEYRIALACHEGRTSATVSEDCWGISNHYRLPRDDRQKQHQALIRDTCIQVMRQRGFVVTFPVDDIHGLATLFDWSNDAQILAAKSLT